MLNKTIHGYTIKKFLGKGGMAEVWYAENRLKKPVAIKIMLTEYLQYPQVIARFETEAQAMVMLDHPNIRQVIDYGEIENRPFIIMEYLEGNDLSYYIESGKKPSSSELENWWQQCLSALQHTHEKGIVHRDIKPANIFLQNNGNIKILDFGIAKVKSEFSVTKTGQDLGTVWYMSPEQVINPKTVTSATDIYSLGVTFAHLLKGVPVFENTDSTFSVQIQITQGKLDLSNITNNWLEILKPALELKAEDRKTAEELINSSESICSREVYQTENKISLKTEDITVVQTEEQVLREKFLKQYDDVGEFKEGFADVRLKNKWGFIDRKGVVIIPLKFDYVYAFSEGLALVELNEEYGFINVTGEVVIPIQYYNASSFSEGLARVQLDDKSGFINKDGEEVISSKYDFAFSFKEGLALVELNGKNGFINKVGEEVIPLKYDHVQDFSEGLAAVKLNQRYGFIDKTGAEVIPLQYDYAFSFSEGLALVELNFMKGFIDKTGAEIIPLQYCDAYSFSEGLAALSFNKKWGFIDKTGLEVIPLQYDDVGGFSEGLSRVKLNDKWGFITKTGKVIIPLEYDSVGDIKQGLTWVELSKEWGFINNKGELFKM